ncbi:peptidase domain-containing ABC transporter [Planomonospora venezuelensis]|uniref:ABC-type bacteriocin/lantibiotic exporter with double-glycine peptidase domain n=1 Tax=Planomonospora venezuelensis TaxID=1999 RepID=A0A841D714_PLAVE|nr:peptidase domain-containing ABC transporter [Planomonospora venezuelensis]MBB5963945.1 ABC-type bacteriocin/lantibiotic exporter with double-glycine peptidase domain [Planomonospora venezuelensis]GIN03893.1 NHLP family bacteriocin export ABC transporter peptidase/permease/ATPase [Planomonospora venezuelensis]
MKVPVILQHSMVECGAACLAMVLAAHGRRVPVYTLSEEMGIGRDGVSALTLVRTAQAHGLATRAASVPAAQVAELPLPAVVHWRHSHFVVVERVSPGRIGIIDPGLGRVGLTPRDFAESYSGVAFTFSPGADFRTGRVGDRTSWWSRYLRVIVSRHRGLLALLILLSLALQALGLVLPAVTETVVDRVLTAGETDLLTLLGLGTAVAAAAQFAVGAARSWALVALRTRADTALLDELARRLLSVPFRFFAHRGSADLVSRISGVTLLREILTGQALTALLDGPLAAGYLLAVTVRSPLLGAILLAFAAAQIILLTTTHRRLADLTHREMEARNEAQGQLIESVRGIETIKAVGAEERVLGRWSRLLRTQMRRARRNGMAQGLQDSALAALRFGTPLALLWAGAWQVTTHQLSLGAMLGLLALAAAALAPLAALTGGLRSAQLARVHGERLADLWNTRPESDARDGLSGPSPDRPAGPVAGPGETAAATGSGAVPRKGPGAPGRTGPMEIELRGVGFRYTPESPWILRGIDLRIPPGRKIALVGRSGSGKSTLARVLLGLLGPAEGEIRYGGIPLSEAEAGRLRRRFGVVTQEPALFTGTILDNITLGDPDAPLTRVHEAARLAHVHDDIGAMPMGYHTHLTEGGGVSGGQRQRIALARALLTRPDILLLDEATSHLDADSEAVIDANLATLTQTRIVIAHRLSTVRDADLIVVLDGGRIAETGTHEELLRLGGHYARLAGRQAGGLALLHKSLPRRP